MHIGVDIGGTKILALAVGPKGKVLARDKKKVKDRSPEAVIRRAVQCARAAVKAAGAKPKEVDGIGVAVPSAVEGGIARFAPALGWRDVDVIALLHEHHPGPVYVDNDVNLGVAAEHLKGAARGHDTVAGFFIGTGVGGAVIQHGQLVKGEDGMAGELGHMIVAPGGRLCGCGNQGCLEAYASKTAFLRQIKHALFEEHTTSALAEVVTPDTRMITSGQLRAAYEAGDALAREVLHDGLAYLGPALASTIAILSPGRIVLGGGVIEAFGAPLVKRIRKWTRPYVFGDPKRARVVVQSALGDDAVPLGAALLAQAKGKLL